MKNTSTFNSNSTLLSLSRLTKHKFNKTMTKSNNSYIYIQEREREREKQKPEFEELLSPLMAETPLETESLLSTTSLVVLPFPVPTSCSTLTDRSLEEEERRRFSGNSAIFAAVYDARQIPVNVTQIRCTVIGGAERKREKLNRRNEKALGMVLWGEEGAKMWCGRFIDQL